MISCGVCVGTVAHTGTSCDAMVLPCRAEHAKTKFHPFEHIIYKKSFYFWVVVLVLLGPSVGFLAAGFLYGTVSGRAEAIGQTLQAVASWVRLPNNVLVAAQLGARTRGCRALTDCSEGSSQTCHLPVGSRSIGKRSRLLRGHVPS